MKLLKIIAILNLLYFSHQTMPEILSVSEWVSPNGTKVKLLGDRHDPSPIANQQVEDFVNHLEDKNGCVVLTEDMSYRYTKMAEKEIRLFDLQIKDSFLDNLTGKLRTRNIPALNIDFRQCQYLKKDYQINIDYWDKKAVNQESILWKTTFDNISAVIPSIFEQELKNLKHAYEDHIVKFDSLTPNEIDDWGQKYFNLDCALFDFVCLAKITMINQTQANKIKTVYLASGEAHTFFLEDTLQRLGYKQIYSTYEYTTKKIATFQRGIIFHYEKPINIKETLEKLDNAVSITTATQAT